MAAPLQKRGLRTGVMIINRSHLKGVGKGLFWFQFFASCIYGRKDKLNSHHHAAASQIKDIEHVVGHFNEGVLAKLFLVLDECGIFDGACKQNEKLKNLVTEPSITVNQKHMSLVEYENLLNMILLSNKEAPIKIEFGDRRFLEFVTTQKKSMDYYRGPDGLAAFLLRPETAKHFYAYLMQLDMGDFAMIEPPMTAEKQASIARSMAPEISFLQALVRRLRTLGEEEAMLKAAHAATKQQLQAAYSALVAANTDMQKAVADAAAADGDEKEALEQIAKSSTQLYDEAYDTENRVREQHVSLGSELQNFKRIIDSRISDKEFHISPTALAVAYADYVKYPTPTSVDIVISAIHQHLHTQTVSKKKPVYIQNFKTERAVVLPGLNDMEAQLKAAGLWTDAFTRDMSTPRSDVAYPLFDGHGIRVIETV